MTQPTADDRMPSKGMALANSDDLCICGHTRDEHADNPFEAESHDRGCTVGDCSCPEFEIDYDDEWDGDEDCE